MSARQGWEEGPFLQDIEVTCSNTYTSIIHSARFTEHLLCARHCGGCTLGSTAFVCKGPNGKYFRFPGHTITQLCLYSRKQLLPRQTNEQGHQIYDPMDCSTPGFSVLHQLLDLAQTHVIELVISSNHLILCCPLLLLPPIPPI